jgi:ABC-type lipoprotein release transport system permease subunit
VILNSQLAEVESLIDEMEGHGFYLVSEKKSIESSKKFIQSAIELMEEESYKDTFSAAKRAYIDIQQTHSHLLSIFKETNASVSMIIVLLAFTSTIIGFLSSNKEWTKIGASIVTYLVVLIVLYLTYPGSVIISIESFMRTAFIAFASILIISRILPTFLKKRSRSYISVRNIVIPIFSIAKRSIIRRKTRLGLTFTAMTILVMSFVVLTSFYQGYGLITVNLSKQESPVRSILLRAPGYTQKDPVFLSDPKIEMDWLRNQEESSSVTLKAENIPFAFPIASLNHFPIFGVIGVESQTEATIVDLNGLLIEGKLPIEGIAISEVLRYRLGVELGDILLFEGERVPLEGILRDGKMLRLNDIDGSNYLPGKEVNINPEGEPPLFETRTCEPDEVVVMHISRAREIPMVKISRIVVGVIDDADVNRFALRLVLDKSYSSWASSEEGVFHARVGSYIEGKGRSLLVLFVIVVLNIVMTMLNSLYERKHEIYILSAVGLNPAHITSIFFVEAGIIGLTAGGLGYLLGMGFYKVLLFIGVTIDVKQKVSVFWSIASLVIAITSILIGTSFSLRYSVIITPSLLKRWRISERKNNFTDPWEISIPIKILSGEDRAFKDYLERALKAYENNSVRKTSSIKVIEDAEEKTTTITFVYKATKSTVDNLYTKNKLLIEEDAENNVFKVTLLSFGEQQKAHQTGSLIRRIVMRWSATKSSQEII